MSEDRLPLADLLTKAGDGDFLRSVAEAVPQMPVGADVEGQIGAARHERTGERLNCRNGFRDRTLDTRLGLLRLRIPKLRQGSYFPPFLEPRKTSEKALVAVIQEAWIGGVCTRRVDGLVQATGLSGISKSGISKSAVSKLCKDIDEMDNSEHDVLAYMAFPAPHRTKPHSTNPPEGLNKKVKRRADVVGTSPSEAAIIRLIGAVLLEANDEWQLQHRHMGVEVMGETLNPAPAHQTPQLPPRAT